MLQQTEEIIKLKNFIENEILICNGGIHRSRFPIEENRFYREHKEEYNKIFKLCEHFKVKDFKECIYIILNDVTELPICKCGKNTNFTGRLAKGYSQYCSPKCASLYTVDKRKAIFLEKYGETSPMKTKEVKAKAKLTVSKQSDERKQEIKDLTHQSKLNNIDENGLNSYDRMVIGLKETKTKNGTLQNSPEIIEKSKQSNLERYGAVTFTASKEGKEQVKQTTLKNHGVTNWMKTEEAVNLYKQIWNNKSQEEINYITKQRQNACVIRYGVKHQMQVSEIAEKQSKSSYKAKYYELPSGKLRHYQGYENFLLDELLLEFNEEQILSDKIDMPEFWYIDNKGTKRRYYPDMYIKETNTIYEVKSLYTLEQTKKNNVYDLKKQCVIDKGYNYILKIYDKKGKETYEE